MKSILRILPVALALFTSPAIVIPSVVEGPGRAEVRLICRAVATEVEYHQPRIAANTVSTTLEIVVAPVIPLRGAATPRAPAA
jgi:hypothetical protein